MPTGGRRAWHNPRLDNICVQARRWDGHYFAAIIQKTNFSWAKKGDYINQNFLPAEKAPETFKQTNINFNFCAAKAIKKMATTKIKGAFKS